MRIEPAALTALENAARLLAAAGAIVEELVLPAPFDQLLDAQNTIVTAEGGVSFLPEFVNAYVLLAPDLRAKWTAISAARRCSRLMSLPTLSPGVRPDVWSIRSTWC